MEAHLQTKKLVKQQVPVEMCVNTTENDEDAAVGTWISAEV